MYAAFLASFVVPPLAISAYLARKRIGRPFLRALAVTLVIVYAATIPWDSAAIAWGIWSFEPGRLLGPRIGPHLPLEEAAFFGLESVLVALVFAWIRGARGGKTKAPRAIGSRGAP